MINVVELDIGIVGTQRRGKLMQLRKKMRGVYLQSDTSVERERFTAINWKSEREPWSICRHKAICKGNRNRAIRTPVTVSEDTRDECTNLLKPMSLVSGCVDFILQVLWWFWRILGRVVLESNFHNWKTVVNLFNFFENTGDLNLRGLKLSLP